MPIWNYPGLLVPTVLLILISWAVILCSMPISIAQHRRRSPSARINLKLLSLLSWGGAFTTGLLAAVAFWRLGQAFDRLLSSQVTSPSDFLAPILLAVWTHLIARLAHLHRSALCRAPIFDQRRLAFSHLTRAIFIALPLMALSFADSGANLMSMLATSIAAEAGTLAADILP